MLLHPTFTAAAFNTRSASRWRTVLQILYAASMTFGSVEPDKYVRRRRRTDHKSTPLRGNVKSIDLGIPAGNVVQTRCRGTRFISGYGAERVAVLAEVCRCCSTYRSRSRPR